MCYTHNIKHQIVNMYTVVRVGCSVSSMVYPLSPPPTFGTNRRSCTMCSRYYPFIVEAFNRSTQRLEKFDLNVEKVVTPV